MSFNLKEFLFDQNFEIVIKKDFIYIKNYKRIDQVNINEISLKSIDNQIKISGQNFKILKLLDQELLIKGEIEKIEYNKLS